ncbi:hypothetical protein N2152v2_007141 [Parachlorella kessleri]
MDGAGKRRQAFSDLTNQHASENSVPAKDSRAPLACQGGGYGLHLQGYTAARVDPCPRLDVVDIDIEDVDDPMACTEIVNDIFGNLKCAETRRRPSTCYMESVQTDINPMMRSILVDWLVEVAQEYRLTSDSLFLSVAYIDRFLSLVDVRRNKLQLVGVTSMLVASKYEEIYAPAIEEFCYITDNTYTREQVLDMEREVLRVLEFDLTQPTTKTFLRRYIKAASGEIALDATYEFLCAYLGELTLMDYGMLHYLPSHIAAAIVLVALYMLNKPTWSSTLQHYTGFMPRDLRRCAQAVHSLFVQAKTSSLPASREKYASSKFASVSQLGTADSLPEWVFSQ